MFAGSLATASSVLWTGCSAGEGIGRGGSALGAADAASSIVISQVYGAGGNAASGTNPDAPLNADYVELFNRGTSDVTISNWSLQYASTSGKVSATATNLVTLNATIKAGHYYLVSMVPGAKGVAGPTPDATGTLSLAAASGTVFLTNSATALPCTTGGKCTDATIIDQVGYGTGDMAYAGNGPTGTALTTATAVIRKGTTATDDGCFDPTGDDNSADFDTITITTSSPRNSSTPASTCAGTTGPVTGGKGLVISQVFPNSGYADSSFSVDFIELFNTTKTPLALDGLTLRYASANGAFSDADGGSAQYTYTTLPTGVSVAPGGYYLVALEGGKSDAGAALPLADYNDVNMNLSGTAGKIAIVSAADTLNGCGKDGGACPLGDFVDLVGYGATASEFEGTGPAPAPGNTDTQSIQRGGAGCTNSSDNSKDFTLATPVPHNSSSPANICGGGVTMDAGTDSGADASADGGTDASSDGGAEGGGGGKDASVDSGTDASTGGKDSGTDASGGGGGGGTGSSGLVISQVYGAGGDNFDADYVEIFNRGSSAVSLEGLSLQYGSAAGDFAVTYGDAGDTNLVVLPNKSVPAGGYFLVGLALGDAGAAITADFTGEANMSATNGKVAIVNGTTALSSCGPAGSPCPTSDFVDLIGYGTASQFEGTAAAPALDYTHAALRGDNGCTDTDENSTDITSGTPAPRNSSTALNVCSGGGGGGGGGKVDSGTSSKSDSGTSGDDDDNGDDDDDSSDSGTGGNKGTAGGSDSGGCSTAGTTSTGDGAASFGLFAFAVMALGRRRKKSTTRA